MEYYDFKVFTRVKWRFTSKSLPFARVNRGKTGEVRVDTPESWHTVCLFFGMDAIAEKTKQRHCISSSLCIYHQFKSS